ncbi:MAG: hypothetical protein J6J24_02305 [Clostridia bacterium]|nr:hypothetical protein [Clostridia bacterium]
MERLHSEQERLSFAVGACGIVFDVINKLFKPQIKMIKLDNAKDYRGSMSLYVALLFSGLDGHRAIVPEFVSSQRDAESFVARLGNKPWSQELQDVILAEIRKQNKIDVRNCFCHGLFDFVVAVDQFGRKQDAFLLFPNRSKNAGTKPIVVPNDSVREFVQEQNRRRLSVLYNADANERKNILISDMSLEIADWYDKGTPFSENFKNNIDKYGMELFSAIVGSMLYVYNQNTLYLDLQEEKEARDVFYVLRNSLCHGNFNKQKISSIFADPKKLDKNIDANLSELIMSVPYFLSLSKNSKNYKCDVVDFVEYLNKNGKNSLDKKSSGKEKEK